MISAIFLGTIIPLILLIVILKGENKLLMAFFSWGLVAFVLSLSLNNLLLDLFSMDLNKLSVTWAPIVEELFKALPLLYFLTNKKNTGYPVIYFAAAAGIGYSIQENYLYLLNSAGTESSAVVYMIVRSITTCLMHGITTAILGYGLQVVRKLKFMILPLLFGLFSVSVSLHALFNLYINSSARLLGMALPIILYMVGLLVLSPETLRKNNSSVSKNQSS